MARVPADIVNSRCCVRSAVALRKALPAMQRLLRKRDQDMFCLNDGSFPEISVEERTAAVRAFLEAYFPIAAPWERDARGAAGAARGFGVLGSA